MKGVATVLLMVLLSVQTFSKWVWTLDYQLNKAYIAKDLCINKSKPQLHCNGKCQLAKKLAEEEENSSKSSGTTSLKNEASNVFFKQDIETPDLSLVEPQQKHYTVYTVKPCHYKSTGVFRPPVV